MYDFEDLDIFFADFASLLTWTGISMKCIFSKKSDPLAFQAGGRDISATVKASDVVGMVSGDELTIDGSPFIVAEVYPIQDGAMFKIMLEEI